jgi:release factor glutamine methyltransferase
LTLHERIAAAREQLLHAGINPREAAIDVDLYARTILKWDRARMLLHYHEPVPAQLEPQFSHWVARRQRFEPTAYIVGEREFWGLDFLVTPAVLIPRPETELVVEATAEIVQGTMSGRSLRMADIGTGSGNIAVSIAHHLASVGHSFRGATQGCSIVATDVSQPALDVARQNARRHGVADRIEFVCTSYLDGVNGQFDLITANPPYVRDIDKRGLSADVLQEPHVALFGGSTGLDHVEAVLSAAVRMLPAGGWLVMEFGFGQEDDVRERAGRHEELRIDHTRADLQGLARTVIIQRR